MQELKKTLNFYISAGSSEQVSRCFVTGGSAQLPGLLESLQGLIDLTVEEINPFERIELKVKLDDYQLDEAIKCGAVAIGLAMRSV